MQKDPKEKPSITQKLKDFTLRLKLAKLTLFLSDSWGVLKIKGNKLQTK